MISVNLFKKTDKRRFYNFRSWLIVIRCRPFSIRVIQVAVVCTVSTATAGSQSSKTFHDTCLPKCKQVHNKLKIWRSRRFWIFILPGSFTATFQDVTGGPAKVTHIATS